jgi:hypothetical protein
MVREVCAIRAALRPDVAALDLDDAPVADAV